MNAKSITLGLAITFFIAPAITAATTAPSSSASKKDDAALDPAKQLEAARKDLAELRTKYRDEHPKVKAQLKKIAALERQLARKR